jgi:putative transposase
MANTYTQLNVHAIFSVKGRNNFLNDQLRPKLFSYINGIAKSIDIYPLAVNGWKDHVHMFFELPPNITLSKVMEIVKANSSKWINKNRFVQGNFEWQRGYSGFTYSRSQRDDVIKYIINQERHHEKTENTFRKEYLALMNKYEIDYDPRYLFAFYDE